MYKENVEIKWECEHCHKENISRTVVVPDAILILKCDFCQKYGTLKWVKDPMVNQAEGLNVRPELMVHAQADKNTQVKAAMGTGISWEIKDAAGNPVSGGNQ